MSLGFHLYQEQTQRLVMTTQMKQAIELLQCSTLELNAFVAEWIDGNPFAEFEPVAHQLHDAWQTTSHPRVRPAGKRDTEEPSILEQTVANEPTLPERLDAQLRMMGAAQEVIQTARFLLGCLDESGYLREKSEDVCACLHVSDDVFEEALTLLHACDPPGIGARSLAECLRLQLDTVDPQVRPLVTQIIDAHLDDVGNGKLPAVAKRLGVHVTSVQQAVDALKKLNPRPGISYGSATAEYVIPDVLVRRVGRDYVIITNEHAEPRLSINEEYAAMKPFGDPVATEYLQKQLQSVRWLLRCLEQRRVTLYRVADAIVRHQGAFFESGMAAMKPLTLRDIASEVGLHESTVSRATRGKYMLTPRGLFEMKFFFSAEVHTDEGVTSANAAKQEIREQIAGENPGHPLSDEALAKALAMVGIRISRRTVAKYREELGIPPSWRRRRYDA